MKTASKVYTALIFIFLYAPIIVLIIFSFNDTDTASRTQFSGFTLRWYQRLFEDRYILEALLNTLIIAVVSAFASTVLGTMAAVGINRMKRMPKKVMMNITNFPMVNPEIVTGVSMMLLFVAAVSLFGGKSLGMASLIIAHITFCLPYVILSVLPKLRQMNPNLFEAAQDCHQLLHKRHHADAAHLHLFHDEKAHLPGDQRAFHRALCVHHALAHHHQCPPGT